MLSRGGKDGAAAGAEMAARVLESGLTPQRAEALDDWFIRQNLSPGGCADLLAATLLVDRITQSSSETMEE